MFYSYTLLFIWVALPCYDQVVAPIGSCQVFPSEYAFLDSSLKRSELPNENCRRYPSMSVGGSTNTEDYTHCIGRKQLRLVDSELGSEQYDSRDYYVWPAGSSFSQLLFIFPTRVNLTTITLHYYSGNGHGLPRLTFYAVPDDFEVWDALVGYNRRVNVTMMHPGELADLATVSINDVNFSTRKVLMYKPRTDFSFALSELELFNCSKSTFEAITTASTQHGIEKTVYLPITEEHLQTRTYTTSGNLKDFSTNETDNSTSLQDISTYSDKNTMVLLAVGVSLTVLILIVGLAVIAAFLLLWQKKRKKKKIKPIPEQNALYSTLDRGMKVKFTSMEMYDQIQLSPSTGQTEPVCKQEDIKILALSDHSDCNKMKEFNRTQLNKGDLGFATYAVVDKKTKTLSQQKDGSSQSQDNINTSILVKHDKVDNPNHQQSERKDIEEMYAIVQKKSKKSDQKSDVPPIPSHTIESLYSIVQKKPKQ